MAEKIIIIISSSRWDDLWTRKQRLANYFSQKGFKVVYIEPPFTLGISRENLKSIILKVKNLSKKHLLINENLLVISSPFLLPGTLCFCFINFIYQIIFYWYINTRIKKVLGKRRVNNMVIINYLPYIPFVIKWLSRNNKIIYDVVDNFSEMKGFLVNSSLISKLEAKLISYTDICIVTNKDLFEKFKKKAKMISLIPNGVDFNHFNVDKEDLLEPDDLAIIPPPRVGFIGTIQYWLDYDLLYFLGEKLPFYSFIFIGPVSDEEDTGRITSFKNFFFLGKKDYRDLPSYLKYLDVLILPFKQTGIAKSASPLKLYEYLATGKPIVSTCITEVEGLNDLVYIASDKDEFLKLINEAIGEKNDIEKYNRRIRYAQQCDWQQRFKVIENLILKLYDSIK